MKSIRDMRILIVSGNKPEIEILGNKITEKYSQEIKTLKLQKSELIIYIPQDINTENLAAMIVT